MVRSGRASLSARLLVSLVLPVAAGCGSGRGVPPDRTLEVRSGRITSSVLAVGRVEPRTRVEVKSKANGIIRKFHVDVSDPVSEGQVIAELDREILESRVAEAEAKLAQAKAGLELAGAEIARIEAERDDPEFEFSRKNLERVKRLHGQGVASDEELEAAEERRAEALYGKRLVEVRLHAVRARKREARGIVEEREALAELARQELEEATIVSPIDGVVLYRYLEEGDAVSSIRVAGGNATVIMTLGDLSELYVDGEVDEVDVGRIVDGQRARPSLRARIHVESYPERALEGRVTRVTPLGLEDANGIVTFEVRIVFANPERLLLANMTANSDIVLEEKEDVLLVSQGALITEGGEQYVRVYDPATGRAERREVEVGISDGAEVEIVSGVREGQTLLLP